VPQVQTSLLGLFPVLSDSCALIIKSLEEAFEVVFKTILSHYLLRGDAVVKSES